MMEMEADAASTASKEEEDGHLPGGESSKENMDSSQERKNEEEAKKANISDEKDDNAQLKEEPKEPKSVNKDTANAMKCPENDEKEDAECSNSKVVKDSAKPSSSSDPGTSKDEASKEKQSAEPAESAKSTSASVTSAVPLSTATLDKSSPVPTKMPKVSDKTPDSGAEVLSPVAPDVVSSPSQAKTTTKQSVSLHSSKGNGSSPLVTTTSSVKPATCSSPTESSVVSSDDSVAKKIEEIQPTVSSQNENMPCSEEASTAGSSSEASDKQSEVIDSSADPLPQNNSASQSVTSTQVVSTTPSTPKSSSVSSSIVSSSTSEKHNLSVNSPSQSTKTPSATVSSSSLSVSKMQSSSVSSSSFSPSSALTPSPPEVSSSKPFPDKNPKPQKSAPKPSFSSPKPSFSSPKPSFSSPKPSFSSPKPSFSSPKPSFSSPKPSFSSPKPSFSSPKPSFSSPKPSFSSPKPSFSSPKPSPAVGPSKCQSSSPRPSGVSSLPVKLSRPQFSSSSKPSPAPSSIAKPSVPSGGTGVNSNSPASQSTSSQRSFHSSPKPSSTPKPSTSSSPSSSTSASQISTPSTSTSLKKPFKPSPTSLSSSTASPKPSPNPPVSSPIPPQPSPTNPSPSNPSTSNSSRHPPEAVPPATSAPQDAQQESPRGENTALPSADFSVPDVRRNCPTEPSSPPTSIVPDVLRTGSEEENRQLGRMMNNPSPFGGGIPPPLMPDLCQRGESSAVVAPSAAPRPSGESNVDLLCPAGLPGNLGNAEEGQADSSNLPSESMEADGGAVDETEENVPERQEVKPAEALKSGKQKGISSSTPSEEGASSSSAVDKGTGSAIEQNKDAKSDKDKKETASDSDVSSSSKEAGVSNSGSEKSSVRSKAKGDFKPKDAEALKCKDNDDTVSAKSGDSSDLKGEEKKEEESEASESSAVAAVPSKDDVCPVEEKPNSTAEKELPKSKEPLKDLKELKTEAIPAEISGEMTVERGVVGKGSASAEGESNSSLMVPPPIAHLPGDAIMKDSSKDLLQKEGKEPKRAEAGPAIPLLKSAVEENDDNPKSNTPRSKEPVSVTALVEPKKVDAPKSDIKENDDVDKKGKKNVKGEGESSLKKKNSDILTEKKEDGEPSKSVDIANKEVGSLSSDVKPKECFDSKRKLGNLNHKTDKKSDLDPKCSINTSVEETVKETFMMLDMVCEEKTETTVSKPSESSDPVVSDSCVAEKSDVVKLTKKSEIVEKEGNNTAIAKGIAEKDLTVSEEKKIKDKHKVDEDAIETTGIVIADRDSAQKQSIASEISSEKSVSASKTPKVVKETDSKGSQIKADENVTSAPKDNAAVKITNTKKQCSAAVTSLTEVTENISVANLPDSKCASSQVQIRKDSSEKEANSSKPRTIDNNHVETVHSKSEKSQKVDSLPSSVPLKSKKDEIGLSSSVESKKVVNAGNKEQKETTDKTTPKKLSVTSSSDKLRLEKVSSKPEICQKSALKEKDKEECEVNLPEMPKDNISASCNMHSINVSSVCKNVPANMKASSLGGDKNLSDDKPRLPLSPSKETNVNVSSKGNSNVKTDIKSQDESSISGEIDARKELTQVSCVDVGNVTENKKATSVESVEKIPESVPTAPAVIPNTKSAKVSSLNKTSSSQDKEKSVSQSSSNLVSKTEPSASVLSKTSANKNLDSDENSSEKTVKEEEPKDTELSTSVSMTSSGKNKKQVTGHEKIITSAKSTIKCPSIDTDCIESKLKMTDVTADDLSSTKKDLDSSLMVNDKEGEGSIVSKDIPLTPTKEASTPLLLPIVKNEVNMKDVNVSLPEGDNINSEVVPQPDACVSPGGDDAIPEKKDEIKDDSSPKGASDMSEVQKTEVKAPKEAQQDLMVETKTICRESSLICTNEDRLCPGDDKIPEESSVEAQMLNALLFTNNTPSKKSVNEDKEICEDNDLSSSTAALSKEEITKDKLSSSNKPHFKIDEAETEKILAMNEKQVIERETPCSKEEFGKLNPSNSKKKFNFKNSNEDKENSLGNKVETRCNFPNTEEKLEENLTPSKTDHAETSSEKADALKTALIINEEIHGKETLSNKGVSDENSDNLKVENVAVLVSKASSELINGNQSNITPVAAIKIDKEDSSSKEKVSSETEGKTDLSKSSKEVSSQKDDIAQEICIQIDTVTCTVTKCEELPIVSTINLTKLNPEGENMDKSSSEEKVSAQLDGSIEIVKAKQEVTSLAPLLNDSDSSDGSKFKKRADVKQSREKSILGITEKLAVANKMRQQKQNTAEMQSKESVSPRKMPGLIEMGVAKASRRKNLALKEDLRVKKAKILCATESNESSENKTIHDFTQKNVTEVNLGKCEVISKVPLTSIGGEIQQQVATMIETPLYKNLSKDLEKSFAASSGNIMDLSSKKDQNPIINVNCKVNTEINPTASLQKDTFVMSTPKASLEIKPIGEDNISPSKNGRGVNAEERKEHGGFKSPRMKRISVKDKSLIESSMPPVGPTTRTRTGFKQSTPPKAGIKADGSKDKNSQNTKNVKVPQKKDEKIMDSEPKRKSVEVSTEPFTKEMETKLLDPSVRGSPSQSPIRSSKLLEVIRVAGEKDIVKVNDVEVMREPAGVGNSSNCPLTLLRKTASNISGYLSVSAHEQRKEPLVDAKNISESVQVDAASAGSKFPSGNTESWEFVAKVGEVELLRESPRVVPKATPPPLTITLESPRKKTKEKPEARKPGRPPAMPPPTKMPEFAIPPMNLMEQTFPAHQNLRNQSLEVLVGIGNRPEGLDLRGQFPPIGMQMGGAPIWQMPTDERGRSTIPRSAGVDFTSGRPSSAGEISSEGDVDKRKKGAKPRAGPPPKWQSQEADLLSVKLDGLPLGTWSPKDWRSIPPTSMGLWPPGYNYGFPIRPKGPMEPRGSRSVSPPQVGQDNRGMEHMPEDLSNPPVPARGRSRDSPHSFRPPFAHPATSFPGGTVNFSNAGVMSYPSPSHMSKNSNVYSLAKSTSSASPASDTAMNLTMCKQMSATPPPLPVLSSAVQQSSRQSSVPVNLVKSRSSSPKTQAQTPSNSDGRGAVLPGGIIVPNLPLIFGRDYSHPTNTPSGRVSHCSAEENRETESNLSQVRCSSEPPRDHVPEKMKDNTSAFTPTSFGHRTSSANVTTNYQPPRPASSTSIVEVSSRQSTNSETNLLPGGVVIPSLFSGNSSKPGEEQWNYENAKSELPVRSASALAQFHTEEPSSKSSTPKVLSSTPVPAPPVTTISTTTPQKTGPGRRGGRSETPPPDKYNFRVEEAHVVRSSDIGGGGPGGNKLYACDICSGVYRRAFSLKRHYLRAHINYCHLSERDLSNCGIVVGDKMAVQTGGSGRRPYVHTTLPKTSQTTADDDDEKANNNVGGRRTLLRDLFRCHTCGVCFDEKKRLKAHLMEHQCGSNRPSLLRQHAATHTPPAVIPKATPPPKQHPSSPTPVVFLCAYCDKRFSSAAVRRRHRKLHESSPGPHPCYLCETSEEAREHPGETSSFAQLEDLRAHMASTHKEVYHSCDLCGERVPSILALEEHAESHRSRRKAADGSDDEEEEAELSRAATATSAEGSTTSESAPATASAQGEEEEFRYTCGVCQKMFTNYVNMCRHRRLAHGAAQAKVTGRKGGATAGVKQGGGDSGSSSRSQSPVVVSQASTGERSQHRDLLDGEPSSSSSSSVPSPCPYPPPYAANDPETLFYTRLAGNIRDNLLNYLDGKLDRDSSNRKIKYDDELHIENGDDSNKIEPYLSWEKYNFPRDFQQMSCWDISTQLVVRNNMIRASNTPPVEQPAEPAFPQILALVETSKAAEIDKDLETAAKEETDVEGEWPGLSGEWIRPRSYICCACASRFSDLWSLEDHQYSKHPNVWCTHLEVEDGAVVLPGTPKLSPGSSSLAVSFLGDLLCRKPLGLRGALLAAPAIPPTLNNGMDSSSAKCTKCSRLCPSLPDLHSHMLECGGDLAWAAWAGGSSPAASSRRNSKKWRPFGSRRRRQRGRRGMKRNIPSSPVKMHRARHRGTDSDTIQRMIANLPAKRATRRVIQFNEDEIKTRSQATIHSVSFTGTFVRVSGYKTSQGVKPGAPTAAKRGRPPKNPVPPSTPVSSEGASSYNASPASVGSPATASPASTTSPGVVVKKGRGRPPGSKSKPSVPGVDLSAKRRIGEALPENNTPEADRYSLVKRSRMGTSPISQHQNSTTTPNAPGEPYICKGCGTVFDNASSCERHGKKCVFRRQMPSSPTADGVRNSSSGSARPVHSCPHCGKNFTYATPMEKHVRACQGIRDQSGLSLKGQPVQVRRATAPDTMELDQMEESEKSDALEESKKDWEVEGVEESAPVEEVMQAPPQEPDMPQLQKEEPVASPLPKDEDIPVLTPVAPDEGDEKKEPREEVSVEAEMQVDVSAVEESEKSIDKEKEELVPTDAEAVEALVDVETVEEVKLVEVKEEAPSAEETEPVTEIMPQDIQEITKITIYPEDESISVETAAEESKETESEKKDEEAVEEKQVPTVGKRTRGSSVGRQGSKKNKAEDDLTEEMEEVETPKKKPGRKSSGGLTKQKTPKAVKSSQAAKVENENQKAEEKEDEPKASLKQEVEEKKDEVAEVPETATQKDTKDSIIAEKDSSKAMEGEGKTETKSKRGRKPKNQKNTPSQVSIAINSEEKQITTTAPSTEKTSPEKKKESPKPSVTIDESKEKSKDEVSEVKLKSIEDDTEVKSSTLAKEKTIAEEESSPSKSIESVEMKIIEEEKKVDESNAKTKEVDESKEAEEEVEEDKKDEEEEDEEDKKDAEAKNNSKLRGTKGSKGKVTKGKKKKKKMELKKEVENFWCDVCQMGYSSAFNLVKHGMSQKHKWNLRLGKEKEAEEQQKKEGEEEEGDEGKSPSKEQDLGNEKDKNGNDEMEKGENDEGNQGETGKKCSTEEDEESKEEANKDAPEEKSVEKSTNETSSAVSSKSSPPKSSKDKESVDSVKNKGAVSKTEKKASLGEESGKKEDSSEQSVIKEESATDGETPSKSTESASSEEVSKDALSKNREGVTGQDQLTKSKNQAGKETIVKSSEKETQSNITKVSPEAVVAAAPESATVNEGTKSTNEGTQRNSWTEATTAQPTSQEFVQPAVVPPTTCNPLFEWDSNMVPPAPMQAQTGGPQNHHQAHQDGWGAYGGWEAPSTDPNPPPSPGLWRYQPPNPMPWGEPQHSLSPIPRVPTYTEDPVPVTHPSPPNPSLGSILDSVNRILGEDGSGFDSTRIHAATAPEDEYGGVGLFGEGSLAELQRAMGATDEEMAMLQQLGTGPLDFVYDNNAGLTSVAEGGPDAQDQTGPLPNAELVDLDNQSPSVTMVEGPIEEAETAAVPAAAINTSEATLPDGLSSKRKRCGPLPSKCKRFPPPSREGRVWRGGRRPALAQTSLASAHLLISQYEKKEMVCPVCNRHFLGLAALETHVSWVHKLKDAKQHILEGESTGYLPGKKATQTTSNSLRELVVGRAGAGSGGVTAASSPTPSRRLPCFVCKELYSDVISLNHHIAQQHLRRRPGEGGAVPEIDGDLKSQMTSALGDLLGRALANIRNRTDPNAKPGLPISASRSPSFIFPKLNLLGKSQEKLSPLMENPRRSFGGPSGCDGDFISKMEPSSESPEVTLFRRDDGLDPSEWSSDGEDSAKGHEIDMLEESAAPSFHHVCPYCGDRFQKLSSRNRHISVAHRDPSCLDLMRHPRNASHDSTDFDDLLNRTKDGDGALKEESSEDLETGRRNNHHPCPGCQLSFLRHSQLEAHLKRAHNGSDSQLPDTSDSMMECPICRESMNHFLKLCKHVKAKHREWSINCFTTEMHHHLILRKESPEESMVIRKKFLVKMKAFPVLRMASPTPSSKSSEEESHMDPDPKGNYLCSVCGVNFKSPQGVIRHLNLEHNSNHLEGALPMQKIFQRNAAKEFRGRTGGGTGSDIKAKAEAALRELNLSQKFKLSSMSGSKGVVASKGGSSRKSEEQTPGGRGGGRGRGSSRRGRGRRGGRSAASSDVEKSLFDVYEFEDDDDDNEEVSSRVGSADGGSSRVDSECGGDDEDEDEEAAGEEDSKGNTPASIKGKRASVDSSSSDVKYTCHSCGKGYKSLSAFWKHTKGVRGLCASGSSSPKSAERGQDATPSGKKASGSKKTSKEDDETSDAESEVGGRVLRRLRGSGENLTESVDGGNSSEVEVGKKGDKAPKKGKRKAEEEKKGAFPGGETVRTYGGKRVKQQQAEERKGRSSEEGSGGRRSTGASEAAFDALRGGGTS